MTVSQTKSRLRREETFSPEDRLTERFSTTWAVGRLQVKCFFKNSPSKLACRYIHVRFGRNITIKSTIIVHWLSHELKLFIIRKSRLRNSHQYKLQLKYLVNACYLTRLYARCLSACQFIQMNNANMLDW